MSNPITGIIRAAGNGIKGLVNGVRGTHPAPQQGQNPAALNNAINRDFANTPTNGPATGIFQFPSWPPGGGGGAPGR